MMCTSTLPGLEGERKKATTDSRTSTSPIPSLFTTQWLKVILFLPEHLVSEMWHEKRGKWRRLLFSPRSLDPRMLRDRLPFCALNVFLLERGRLRQSSNWISETDFPVKRRKEATAGRQLKKEKEKLEPNSSSSSLHPFSVEGRKARSSRLSLNLNGHTRA